jgi:Holliday junction resolvase RusA-like endonuclease
MTADASFFVAGLPIPQGSTRAFVAKGRAIVTHDNAQVRPWRQDVAACARAARVPFLESGPVALTIAFTLPRPKSRPKRATHPDVRPDLDKLARGISDALTTIAWRDDAQVVDLIARKRYGLPVGARVTVGRPTPEAR